MKLRHKYWKQTMRAAEKTNDDEQRSLKKSVCVSSTGQFHVINAFKIILHSKEKALQKEPVAGSVEVLTAKWLEFL